MISETEVTSVHNRLQDAENSLESLHESTSRACACNREDEDLFNARLLQLQQSGERAVDSFQALLASIDPWPSRHPSFPAPTAARIDRAISRMEDLLAVIRKQLDGAAQSLQVQKDSLQETLDRLSQQRSAHRGYQPPSGPARYLKENA